MPGPAERDTAATPANEATAASGNGTATASRFQTSVSLVQALVWPLIVVFIICWFNAPITQLVSRISSGTVKVPGGGELTFVAAAIVASGKQEIKEQVTQLTASLPVTVIAEATKGSTSQIPLRIQQKTQALDLIIGSNGYTGDAIEAYLLNLTAYDFFKYVIFVQSNKALFGMIEARTLFALLQDSQSGWTYQRFADAVNGGSETDRSQLSQLPGFVPKTESVDAQTQKREVLERMVRGRKEWLPVAQADGRFQGVIDRTNLIASIVLDVTDRITTASSQTN